MPDRTRETIALRRFVAMYPAEIEIVEPPSESLQRDAVVSIASHQRYIEHFSVCGRRDIRGRKHRVTTFLLTPLDETADLTRLGGYITIQCGDPRKPLSRDEANTIVEHIYAHPTGHIPEINVGGFVLSFERDPDSEPGLGGQVKVCLDIQLELAQQVSQKNRLVGDTPGAILLIDKVDRQTIGPYDIANAWSGSKSCIEHGNFFEVWIVTDYGAGPLKRDGWVYDGSDDHRRLLGSFLLKQYPKGLAGSDA